MFEARASLISFFVSIVAVLLDWESWRGVRNICQSI